MTTKRKLREQVADLEARNAILAQQLEEARSQRDSWEWAAKTATGQLDDQQVLVHTAQRDAARFRLAWQSARRRAVANGLFTSSHNLQADLLLDQVDRLFNRTRRLRRACARYRAELAQQQRVNDRLSDQLMSAMGYTDAHLQTLGVKAKPMSIAPIYETCERCRAGYEHGHACQTCAYRAQIRAELAARNMPIPAEYAD